MSLADPSIGSPVNRERFSTEPVFARLGVALVAHPVRWLVASLVVTGLLASQLPKLHVDTSVEGILNPDSPAIGQYAAFKNRFGNDMIFMILVETEDAFAPAFVDALRRFHAALRDEIETVDRVDSLVNARRSYTVDGELHIEALLEDAPLDDPAALEVLRDYASSNTTYQRYLISDDRQLVSVMVRLLPFQVTEDEAGHAVQRPLLEADLAVASAAIDEIVERFGRELSTEVHVAGGPRLQVEQGKIFQADFGNLTTLAIVIISALLYWVFRRLSGVLIPITVMVFGLVATFSAMPLLGAPMQLTSAILPCFLLAVCVGDSIHLLNAFFARYDAGGDKAEALQSALVHTGPALLFTTLTTAAGLLTFSTSNLYLVANLGTFAAIGSVAALVYTVVLAPVLIVLCPLRRSPTPRRESTIFHRWVEGCVRAAVVAPRAISIGALVAFLGFSALALQLGFSNDTLSWLDAAHPTRVAMAKAEDRLGGTIPLEIVIDSGQPGGAAEPALLRRLDASLAEFAGWREGPIWATKTTGLPEVVREINRVLNDGDAAHDRIPDDRQAVRQELLLLEMDMPDNLVQFTDSEVRYLRASVMVPWGDSIFMQPFSDRLADHFATEYPEFTVTLTGVGVVLSRVFVEMLRTTIQSYVIAFIAIAALLVLLMGDWRMGLASLLPNLLPIAIVLGSMQLLGGALDMFSLMVGSIALGITVDDTVHFIHHFRRNLDVFPDTEGAVRETLRTTGRAMTITSVALALGFLSFGASDLLNLRSFGLVTTACVVLALLANFVVAPALMVSLLGQAKRVSA